MIYSPNGLMRYNDSNTIVDDIPLLSQWIKKQTSYCLSVFWWERVDSNHRSQRQQIYSLPPLATREHSHIKFQLFLKAGAGGRTRTPDLLITNQLLYQLSYTSAFSHAFFKRLNNITQQKANVKHFFEKNNLFYQILFWALKNRLFKGGFLCFLFFVNVQNTKCIWSAMHRNGATSC